MGCISDRRRTRPGEVQTLEAVEGILVGEGTLAGLLNLEEERGVSDTYLCTYVLYVCR
jgi:hypothetical protein